LIHFYKRYSLVTMKVLPVLLAFSLSALSAAETCKDGTAPPCFMRVSDPSREKGRIIKIDAVTLDQETLSWQQRCAPAKSEGIQGHICFKIDARAEGTLETKYSAKCVQEKEGNEVFSRCRRPDGGQGKICKRRISGWFCYIE